VSTLTSKCTKWTALNKKESTEFGKPVSFEVLRRYPGMSCRAIC